MTSTEIIWFSGVIGAAAATATLSKLAMRLRGVMSEVTRPAAIALVSCFLFLHSQLRSVVCFGEGPPVDPSPDGIVDEIVEGRGSVRQVACASLVPSGSVRVYAVSVKQI